MIVRQSDSFSMQLNEQSNIFTKQMIWFRVKCSNKLVSAISCAIIAFMMKKFYWETAIMIFLFIMYAV